MEAKMILGLRNVRIETFKILIKSSVNGCVEIGGSVVPTSLRNTDLV